MASNTSFEVKRGAEMIHLTTEMRFFDLLPTVVRDKINGSVAKNNAKEIWDMIYIGLPDERKEQVEKYTVDQRIGVCLQAIDIRDRNFAATINKDMN